MTGFVRETGFTRAIPSPAGVTSYAKERLGLAPIGLKERSWWYKRLKDELEAQNWSYQDCLDAIDYVAGRQIRLKFIDGIFWYVDRAKAEIDLDIMANLQVKVAQAIEKETDSTWLRRLSLAQGKALERVYIEWSRKNESQL